MSFTGGSPAIRIPYRLIAALTGAVALVLAFGASSAHGAQATIVNSGNNWLQSLATTGEENNHAGANIFRISMLVKHDPGVQVTGIKVDDDYNGTDETTSKTAKSVTLEQPTVAGGFEYSRVSLTYDAPTTGGFDCSIGGATRNHTRPLRVRAVTNDPQSGDRETATSSTNVGFLATGQCTGLGDPPVIFAWGGSNFNQDITPGNHTFSYTGDDIDSDTPIFGSSDDNFRGVNWRVRNARTGTITATGSDCDGNDNQSNSLTINFPDRGSYVVEGETLNDNCQVAYGGNWWPIGSVDVNSSGAPSLTLSSSRPANSADTTITATVSGLDPDNADGGRAEYVQWDLDDNNATGPNGYEETTLGDAITGLADEDPGTSGIQVRQTVASNRAAGTYNVQARVVDNGAMGGADNIRRTSADASTTYQGNTPPVAANQTVTTESDASKPITLSAADTVNNDNIVSYNVTSQPPAGQGSVTPAGSGGAARTYNPSGTFAGPTTFQFTATDSVGGTTGTDATPATVTVNVTPQTQIDSTPPANSSSSSGTFNFSSPATTPGITFECRIDSTLESDFTACEGPRTYPGLTDGSHTFEVRARIGALVDPTPASYTWVLDGTLPETTIDAAPSNPSNDISPTFNFSSDETVVTFECRVDSTNVNDFAPCTNPYTFGAAEGEHTFDVRAVDEFGRRDPTPASYTWRVDTTAPTVTFDATPPNPSNSATAHFEFSSSDQTATFKCSLDGAAFATCSSPQDLTGLGEGTHDFRVQATDTANNTGPIATYTWTVDLTTPETSLDAGPADPSTSPVATFEFSSTDGTAGFECRLDSTAPSAWEECSSPQLYADLGDGQHTFEVRATDAAGNKDGTPETWTWTIDTTAPETTIDAGPTGTTNAVDHVFEFSADDDPGATFECRLDTPTGAGTYSGCTDPQSYTGLGAGTYTFRVKATDALGNAETTPATRTFTIDTGAPTATIESGPSDPSSSDSATFDFSSDEDATFECRLDGEVVDGGTGWVACSSGQGYTGLDDGDHTFEVRATDGVGNPGAADSHTWEVDTTAPDVSITGGGMPATTSSTSASIEFTSTDGTAEFQCKLDGGGWQICTSPKTYSGLDEGSHTFEVRSRDAAGNVSSPTATDTWTVTDSDAPDTFIDSAPDDPTAATNAAFTFSSDEAGTTYECALDSTTAYSSCNPPKTYTGLAPGNHTFRVRATDLDGNVDQSPAVITWSISAPPTPVTTQPTQQQGGGGVAGATAKAPTITAATGKLKLRGRATAGTITCGSAACAVTGKAKAKIGGTSYRLRLKVPASIPADGTATVAVIAPKAARTALAGAGKGILTVKLSVTSGAGNLAKKIKLKVKK